MDKSQLLIVALYVILGVLNLGFCVVGIFTSSKLINLLVGAYMLFRAKQEFEKVK